MNRYYDSDDDNEDEDDNEDDGMRWYSNPYSTPPPISSPPSLAQPNLNNGTGLYFNQAQRNQVLQR